MLEVGACTYLDLNFGELDFDISRNVVTARVFGAAEEPVLERTFSLRTRRRRRVPPGARVPPAVAPRRRFGVWVLCLGLIVVFTAGAGH